MRVPASKIEEVSESDDVELATAFVVNENLRLCNIDRHNWALQKRGKSVWLSFAFYPDLENGLRGLSRHLAEKQFQKLGTLRIEEAVSAVRDLYDTIIKELKAVELTAVAREKRGKS